MNIRLLVFIATLLIIMGDIGRFKMMRNNRDEDSHHI